MTKVNINKPTYYNIHNHTMYSNTRFLDAINSVKSLFIQSVKKGLAGISISDHQSLAGHMRAQQLIENLQQFSPDVLKHFKITFGDEIYLVSRSDVKKGLKQYHAYHHYLNTHQGKQTRCPYINFYHFTLTARNAHGYELLERLNLKAWKDSFMYGKDKEHLQRRLPTYTDWLALVMKKYRGDVIASTACLGSELSQDVWQSNYKHNIFTYKGESKAYKKQAIKRAKDEAIHAKKDLPKFINYLIRTFGKDNVYFELMPSTTKQQQYVNKGLWALSKKTGIKTIISTDSHFADKHDEHLHQMMLHAESHNRNVHDYYHYAHLFSYNELTNFFTPEVLKVSAENSLVLLNSIKQINLRKVKRTNDEWKIQAQNMEESLKITQKYVNKVRDLLANEKANTKDLAYTNKTLAKGMNRMIKRSDTVVKDLLFNVELGN